MYLDSFSCTFHPFQWRNWTPQAMLYLKGGGKRVIHLLYATVQRQSNTFHLSLSLRAYHAARPSHSFYLSFASPP
uniref:Uncharacterized protein n=1 Tax=Gadus morhua TaxID=8049 RepID=A0A8C5APE5_GADMO